MQIVSPEMSKTIYWEKYEKYQMSFAESFTQHAKRLRRPRAIVHQVIHSTPGLIVGFG